LQQTRLSPAGTISAVADEFSRCLPRWAAH
jgi:hypothetical protein